MTRNTIKAICPPKNQYPWLVYFYEKQHKAQIFYDVEKGKWETKRIPNMSNLRICTNAHGWLVVLDLHPKSSTSCCFLLNPISMEKIMLPPPLVPLQNNYSCLLTTPPSDPTCRVAFLERLGPHAMWCRPGAKSWREQVFDFLDHPRPFGFSVICGTKIYCLSRDTANLSEMSFDDDDDDELEVRPLLLQGEKRTGYPSDCPLLVGNNEWVSVYLVESQGDIYLINIFRGQREERIVDIWAFKMDFHKLKWVRVSDLGDHRVFFLSDETSMSCSTTVINGSSLPSSSVMTSNNGHECVKENTIYIILPVKVGKTSLYVYDLEEKTIITRLVCPNVIPNITHGYWVMPMAN